MYTVISGLDDGVPSEVAKLMAEAPDVRGRAVLVVPSPFPLTRRRDWAADMQGVDASGPARLVGEVPSQSVEVPDLEYWTVEAHAYSTDVAARFSFLSGLFRGEAKVVNAGVVHEAKRFTRQVKDTGEVVEVGVAVRIVAAATEWSAQAELTLPNLAADAQLNRHDARITIEVVGFTGALGSLLPAPTRLDVSSLASYLSAFAAIQGQVFSEAGLAYLKPTVLGIQSADGAT